MERNTEITNQECLRCIWGPFPIDDVVVLVHIESELLRALGLLDPATTSTVIITDSAELL